MSLEFRPRGFCGYWNAVFLKSNSRIPCGCDHGEPYTLAEADIKGLDFVTDVLNGPALRRMRVRTTIERRAFIDECRRCAFFKPYEPVDTTDRNPRYQRLSESDARVERYLFKVQAKRGWPLGSIDSIADLHLEPSLPCTLRCPGCQQGFVKDLLRREGPPFYLSLEVVEAILESLTRHDVDVRRFGFGGRGEPTLNPHLPEIIRRCRETFPGATLEMDTNAQHRFKDEFLLLDTMQCSIDGSTPESYATYRIGGRFEPALAFLQTAAERKRALGAGCKVVWKYILFNTTESIEALDRAQRLARDFAVDELVLVITWMAGTNGKVFPPRQMTELATVEHYLRSNQIFEHTRVKYQ